MNILVVYEKGISFHKMNLIKALLQQGCNVTLRQPKDLPSKLKGGIEYDKMWFDELNSIGSKINSCQ